MMRRILLLASIALACSRAPAPRPTGPEADVPLTIVNHNWQDIVIYIAHDGVVQRVAQVTAVSKSDYILPWRYFSSQSTVYLIADPVGSTVVHYSDNLLVQPGQQIVWTLEDDLSRSSVGVY